MRMSFNADVHLSTKQWMKFFVCMLVSIKQRTWGNCRDTDRDGIPDHFDPDDDNDGIPDEEDPDDDGDNIPDIYDPDQVDSDGDGLPDSIDPDDDNDGIPDADDPDDDGDGIPDLWEAVMGPVDKTVDSDLDGIPDYLDSDDDNDGIPDFEGNIIYVIILIALFRNRVQDRFTYETNSRFKVDNGCCNFCCRPTVYYEPGLFVIADAIRHMSSYVVSFP